MHHLALTDEAGKLVNVLSQVDVLRFMNTDAVALLGDDAFRSVQQLGLARTESRRVKCVRSSTPTIDAFCAMQRHGLSSLAVVNDHWQLVGNLSASDITLLVSLRFVQLIHSVAHFLASMREAVFKPRPLVAVDEGTSLGSVIAKLMQHKVHHRSIFLEIGELTAR